MSRSFSGSALVSLALPFRYHCRYSWRRTFCTTATTSTCSAGTWRASRWIWSYLDPPFNSNADYNVLFAEKSGERAHAQIKAFEDTWEWDTDAARNFTDAVENGGQHVARCMLAFKTLLGQSDMLAYLSMMAPRLVELRRVMKPTASIYLHCDPTASHYLKMLMDAVFGPEQFRSEIIWKRTSAHVNPRRFAPIHDTILFYSRSPNYVWNLTLQAYESDYLSNKYRHSDERGSYRLSDLTGDGLRDGDSGKPWRGFDPSNIGRHWAVPRAPLAAILGETSADGMTTQEKLDLLDANNFIYWTPKGRKGGVGFPQLKRFVADGMPVQDVVTDIFPINSQAQERLGYPTQKPEALLERFISASSNQGDMVLDPFCGCGTAIAAAQRLGRRWVGIDVTHLAIKLIKGRLADSFGEKISENYSVVGEPTDLDGAKALAEQDKYQFQYWALGLAHPQARPEVREQKKGADKGIDGRLNLVDATGDVAEVIFSVKGGHVSVAQVRDLRGVIEREGAAIGVFICLEDVTAPMRKEAADAGFYQPKVVGGTKHPRLQILTIRNLLDGKRIDLPAQTEARSFKQAPKAKRKGHAQQALPFDRNA